MKMRVRALGAAEGVTGSCHVVQAGKHTVLLDCGLFQGGRDEEARNREPLPIDVDQIDAVVLSHAHIDHSGRLPLLVKQGYKGPIYTHHASKALCDIMLQDSAFLQEKDAEWENKRRDNTETVLPLYDREDAANAIKQFHGLGYGEAREIAPGLIVRLLDAGHILGSAIVELWQKYAPGAKLVFSGDLGYRDAPVMRDPTVVEDADLVLLESTYGDRLHRPHDQTLAELAEIFGRASSDGGNILIPAFAVGRTQDLLYLLAANYGNWGLADWTVFLDSPMAIETTEVYAEFQNLYDAPLFDTNGELLLQNLILTRTPDESRSINRIRSGAIIIAGSGMCTGGRIRHHLKHNISRPECHVLIIGFQARGTLGRRLVDGAETIQLWGETHPVRATIHTVGGLSAHADQCGLVDWYGSFSGKPRVALVHGEEEALSALRSKLHDSYGVSPHIMQLEHDEYLSV